MITISNLTFRHGSDSDAFSINVPGLSISDNKRVTVIGPSGSGKTTLLHLIAGILVPNKGAIRIDDIEISEQPDGSRRDYRISNIGMIFQEFELLDYLSVRENILLPFRVNGSMRLTRETTDSVNSLAETLGIDRFLERRPKRLSQGERQRVAIGRALITRPKLILADEPTGNLDPETSHAIVKLILDHATDCEATVLMVTHDHSLLDQFDEMIDMSAFGV